MIQQTKFLLIGTLLILSSFTIIDLKIFNKFSNTEFELEFLGNTKYSFSKYNYQIKSYEIAYGAFKLSNSNSIVLKVDSLSEDLYDSTYVILKMNNQFDTVLSMQRITPYFSNNETLYLTFVNDSTVKVKYKMDTATLYSHSKGYFAREYEEY